MGRRSDHSREELTGLILAAAMDIAGAEGLPGLTARRIADRIGYAPGTIYNVFDHLDELILHVRGRALDALFRALSAKPLTGEPLTDLLMLGRAYTHYTGTNAALWSVVLDHRIDRESVPDWYHSKALRLVGLLETALQPLFIAGEEERRRLAGQTLWASLHGMHQLQTAGALVEPVALDDMVELLVASFVDGIRAQRVHFQRQANSPENHQ